MNYVCVLVDDVKFILPAASGYPVKAGDLRSPKKSWKKGRIKE
jgi:hypothetical protein